MNKDNTNDDSVAQNYAFTLCSPSVFTLLRFSHVRISGSHDVAASSHSLTKLVAACDVVRGSVADHFSQPF